MDFSTPGFPVLHFLLEFAHWSPFEFSQIDVLQVIDVLQASHPLLSPLLLLASIFPSIRVFPVSQFFASHSQNVEFQLQHQFFQWIFRVELLAAQGTLKSLLQHHYWKASILQHSICFMVQLSYPYMTTGKTIALTVCTFVSKVMFLLLNTLFRFVITFLLRSKHLLISWLQLASAVILEPRKLKCYSFHLFSFSLPWSVGTKCHDFSLLNVEYQGSFFTLLFHPHQETLIFLHLPPLEWYHLHIWSCWYFPQQSWFQLVLHPAQLSHDVLCIYKQGGNIQPCRTPFPVLNQSVVPRLVLTVASWPACRFLRRQVVWSRTPVSLGYSLFWTTQRF